MKGKHTSSGNTPCVVFLDDCLDSPRFAAIDKLAAEAKKKKRSGKTGTTSMRSPWCMLPLLLAAAVGIYLCLHMAMILASLGKDKQSMKPAKRVINPQKGPQASSCQSHGSDVAKTNMLKSIEARTTRPLHVACILLFVLTSSWE
eukprot:scaffold312824_cov38-Prasinocladus_malaysianus.AAC.1